jgi:hypothetical protein
MSPIAKVMLRAAVVAYPDPVTIAPKTDLQEEALAELRDGDFLELWDSWPNGDRRWIATPIGRQC